jgi:hypothetical protein
MEGNTSSDISTESFDHVLRITFGIVHGVILTLFSFSLILFFPAPFALFGCIVTPLLSFILTVFCNACVEYVSSPSQSAMTVGRILATAWIPPLGVFCVNLVLLPLKSMPAILGHVNVLVFTSIIVNFLLTTVLQVYAAKNLQAVVSKSSGVSSPT